MPAEVELLRAQLSAALQRAQIAEAELVNRRIGSLNRNMVLGIMAADGLQGLFTKAALGDKGALDTVEPLWEAMEKYRAKRGGIVLAASNGVPLTK